MLPPGCTLLKFHLDWLLCGSEYLGPIGCQANRVLPMRRQRAIGGTDRPPVIIHGGVSGACVEHGLDAERHPRSQTQPLATPPIVGHLWLLVHLTADAMTHIFFNDPKIVALADFGHGGPDVSKMTTLADLANADP